MFYVIRGWGKLMNRQMKLKVRKVGASILAAVMIASGNGLNVVQAAENGLQNASAEESSAPSPEGSATPETTEETQSEADPTASADTAGNDSDAENTVAESDDQAGSQESKEGTDSTQTDSEASAEPAENEGSKTIDAVTAKGIHVTAVFDYGTFPDGVQMEAQDIADPTVIQQAREALESKLEEEGGSAEIDDSMDPVAVDVSFFCIDENGEKVEAEPADSKEVKIVVNAPERMTSSDNAEGSQETDTDISLQVVHLPENGDAQVIDDVTVDDNAAEAEFSVDSFSPLLLFPVRRNASAIKQLTNEAPKITDKEEMEVVYSAVGKYQLNYCGTSNGFSEDGAPHGKILRTGFSHLAQLKSVEDEHCYNSSWKNSGGSKLENVSSLNKKNIEKAYLTIEYNWGNENVDGHCIAQYPVTLVYGGNDDSGTVEADSVREFSMTEYITSKFDNNSFGYVDITDYVKQYGYGWYYCCNIPFRFSSDASADWKIVVVEKNENLHDRLVKLEFGKRVNTTNSWSTIEVSGDGVRTLQDTSKPVTGQFLYNISNSDVYDCGHVQISDDGTAEHFKDVIAANGNRTAKSPLNMLKTRNTVPIAMEVNYEHPETHDDRQLVGSDVELLDIDGNTDIHNITLAHDADEVALRFNPEPAWLVTNMLGIAVDVDISNGEVSISNAKRSGGKDITVTGTAENLKSSDEGTSIRNGKVVVTVNPNYVIGAITAKFNGTALDDSKWTVSGNQVTFTFGPEGKTVPGDMLTYSIETTAVSEGSISSGTVTNTVKLTGDSYNHETKAKEINLSKKAETKFSLSVDPNGGTYANSTGTSTISTTLDPLVTASLGTPKRTGYTFKGWKIKSGGHLASINGNTFTMGLQDTVLQAEWEIKKYTVTVSADFKGIKKDLIPEGFKISVSSSDPAQPFLLEPSESGKEYSWTIKDVPYHTNLQFTESNYDVTDYSVEKEVSVNGGQAVSGISASLTVEDNGANSVAFTNTYSTFFTVTKEWDDEGWSDVTRPDSVTVQLYKTVNGSNEAVGEAVTLSDGNGWKHKWSQLKDIDESGNDITYSVQETPVKGYAAEYIRNDKRRVTVKNRLYLQQIGVLKTWDDQKNKYSIRPENVTVHLYRDGNSTEIGNGAVLSEDNHWYRTFSVPIVDKDGNHISYRVTEDPVSGYDTSIAWDENRTTAKVTNSLQTEDITVTKTWIDQDDSYKNRPESIKIHLIQKDNSGAEKKVADADLTASTVSDNTPNEWTYVFTGLPVYDANGKAYSYSVTEDAVPGYDSSIKEYSVTNVFKTRDITVTKVWNDANNKDGIRPASITVQLFRNGESFKDPVTITSDQEWTYTFKDVPVEDADGKAYEYSVKENEVSGYTASVNGTTITNTHIPHSDNKPEKKSTVSAAPVRFVPSTAAEGPDQN